MTPKQVIYLDHAATTPLHPKALEAMLPYLSQMYGNPSAIYSMGQEARHAVEEARRTVADIIGCLPEEIIFTSGGTESDNLALKGTAFSANNHGNHIITSGIEHHAVLETCHFLERFGFKVTYIPVDNHGMIDTRSIEQAITDQTILISIMLANNEVGTIQPVADIASLTRTKTKLPQSRILLHTDAIQGAGALDLNVNRLGIDMLSLSAHKFGGPKGVGILYLRKGVPCSPQQNGGSQERGRRAGTENVAGIVGAATALKLAAESRETNYQHCQKLRDLFVAGVKSKITEAHLVGHPTQRLPNNANFCFKYVEGESILLHLDFANVSASSGSACASSSLEASHVLLAMGVPPEMAHGSIRFTFGIANSGSDVDYVLSILPGIVDQLRSMSPFAPVGEDRGKSE